MRIADERKLHTRITMHCLPVSNVGGARQFSLISSLSGAPNAEFVCLEAAQIAGAGERRLNSSVRWQSPVSGGSGLNAPQGSNSALWWKW